MFFVAKEQLPTPAALSELAFASPNPTDGICTRFDLGLNQQPKAKHDSMNLSCFIDTALPEGKGCPHRPSSNRVVAWRDLLRQNHWIERRD